MRARETEKVFIVVDVYWMTMVVKELHKKKAIQLQRPKDEKELN